MGEVCAAQKKSWLCVTWQTCNVFMSVFFSLATYVQVNDPDAGLWMRLCPGGVSADLYVMISSAVVAMLGWKLYKERITEIFQQEEGREFSGLMLTVVWLVMCRHSGRAPVGMLRVSTAVAITVFPFVAWLYYYINKELTVQLADTL
ncbi:Transmembrane protein 220 [Larimichthys crocea]|uniref:Uncharacterized protein n=1 Tax=Larimichthys crocea TaxID=215358 RepID=A0ACD3R5K0_LARCR|nr:Transmembrane protein 220 [Larimichthys crocea]